MKKLLFLISTLFLVLWVNGQTNKLPVNQIHFEGNKTTKEKILLAELNFSLGDSLDVKSLDSLLDVNTVKLYNLQLFHWVKYDYKYVGFGYIDITFKVQERWYIWPVPIFSLADRNLNAWLNKMDFNRIDYGIHVAWYNFRGRNEALATNIQHGFNRKYELFYIVPQINKKQNIGLSFGGSYYQSHYIDYINEEAKPLTLPLENEFPVNRKYFRAGIINRNTAENVRNLRFEINRQSVLDTVLKLNPNYHLTGNDKTFFQVEINQVLNKRKTFSYPLSGSFLEVAFRQKFFFEEGESSSSRFQLFYSKYQPISKKSYYSIGLSGQYMLSNNLSSSENIALGFKKYVRGFDYYVVDGQHYGLVQNNLNTTILGDKKIKLNFVPSEKFNEIPISVYYGIFVDAGYVYDNDYKAINVLSNQFLYSLGTGLHVVSYYDQVFVLEYTLNNLMEHGIFVSTKFSF